MAAARRSPPARSRVPSGDAASLVRCLGAVAAGFGAVVAVQYVIATVYGDALRAMAVRTVDGDNAAVLWLAALAVVAAFVLWGFGLAIVASPGMAESVSRSDWLAELPGAMGAALLALIALALAIAAHPYPDAGPVQGVAWIVMAGAFCRLGSDAMRTPRHWVAIGVAVALVVVASVVLWNTTANPTRELFTQSAFFLLLAAAFFAFAEWRRGA